MVREGTLFLTISQSGETADTLAALKLAKQRKYLSHLAICNVPESSIVREAALVLMTRAGPEIGVASTKAFTTQLVALALFSLELARIKGLDAERYADGVSQLEHLPGLIGEALKLDPRSAGALHVMGMWNYNVMRLSGMTRFFAKQFLGGKVFDSANWDDAQRYMEESVRNEPNRLVHHLDLARVYAARDDNDRARVQYELTIKGTPTEYNDKRYQAEAAEELRKL